MEETVKILLCEDDENLGMLLREYLQAKGFATTLCPDGEAGFKEFTKNKYDIAVLDVMMPKKDGFTLAQEIRQLMRRSANHLPYCQDFEGGYPGRFQD